MSMNAVLFFVLFIELAQGQRYTYRIKDTVKKCKGTHLNGKNVLLNIYTDMDWLMH